MDDADLPEIDTQVVLVTKHPAMILKATWCGEVYKIHDHWAIKTVRPDEVDRWDYVGQGS